MQFNHLRSMAALFQPKLVQVDESYSSDFDRAKAAVQKALNDLEGVLGKAGSIDVMMHRSGLSAQDKVPDAEGRTILQNLQHKTKEYKKSIMSNLDELELMVISLSEAHKHTELSSGWLKDRAAKDKVADVRDGRETVDVDGVEYKSEGKIAGNKLEQGMLLMGSYSGSNQGALFIEVLGFTDNNEAYSEKVTFDSIKDVFDHHGVSSLKELNNMERGRPYGHSTYVVWRER